MLGTRLSVFGEREREKEREEVKKRERERDRYRQFKPQKKRYNKSYAFYSEGKVKIQHTHNVFILTFLFCVKSVEGKVKINTPVRICILTFLFE